MSNYNLIKEAIKKGQSVTGTYKGGVRNMTPHVIGTNKGANRVLFYQYGGYSSTGIKRDRSKNWKCIPVDQIADLFINDDPFETADNHSRKQNCVDTIDEEVIY